MNCTVADYTVRVDNLDKWYKDVYLELLKDDPKLDMQDYFVNKLVKQVKQ
jgi:hypothetical protein